MSVIRWCLIINGKVIPHSSPTAIDLLKLANEKLADKDELSCCMSDGRSSDLFNVKKLINDALLNNVEQTDAEGE